MFEHPSMYKPEALWMVETWFQTLLSLRTIKFMEYHSFVRDKNILFKIFIYLLIFILSFLHLLTCVYIVWATPTPHFWAEKYSYTY
jgi:hypothetical protein